MSQIKREISEYETLLLNYLLKKGYPRSSILLEGQLDPRVYVDFIVTDINTGLPLMMIEVKSCSERTQEHVRRKAFETLKRYYQKSNLPLKTIAAIFDRDKNILEFVDFTEAIKENNYEALVDDYELPAYQTLTVGAKRKSIKQKEGKQTKNLNVLKLLCWIILPIIGIALLLLDAFDIYTFSTLRIIVIGSLAAIILLPCFKEIKIGEVLLKKEIEEEKKENNNE